MPDDAGPPRAGGTPHRGGARRGPGQRSGSGDDRLGARTPSGRGEPAGIDRARRTRGAPPRPGGGRPPAPPRPDLPDDEEAHLPRAVRREIERVLGPGDRARDVGLALSVGADAIDTGRIDVALEALAWAKHVAPRVAGVREAHGVARYLDEDWAGALTELQAYRRMTGRSDQNHLIADCLRGLDRGVERVAELVEELLADARAPVDRRAEGVIVWAGALADDGQLAAARALVRRHLQQLTDTRPDPDTRPAPDTTSAPGPAEPATLRLLVFAADLADRDGDQQQARSYRDQVARTAPELLEEPVPDEVPPDAT